ncbi:MAG: hypothetical protein JSR55_06705, partial [Proteobacteria bacterium]|nr:hypothetical protein [Pseudomonadota bacterium]
MSKPRGPLTLEIRRAGGVASASIARTFPEHLPIYACSVLFTACTYVVARYFHAPLDLYSSAFILGMGAKCLVIGVTIVVLIEFINLIRSGFPEAPARIPCMHLLRWFSQGDRPGNLFHSLIAFSTLAVSFTTLKEAIPKIHPFSWDTTFMQWGRIIGFGHLPWEILQPVLGYAPVTTAINFAYDMWFFVMFGCLFWQAFSAKGGVLRLQFLLAFSFAWFIGGNLLATAFSSAGPCFYGFLHPGHDPYAAQMAYLHAINRNWPIFS